MKNIIILILIASSIALGNAKVIGNGGNVVICKNNLDEITKIELLDYYELRLNGRELSLNTNLNSFEDILNDLFERWMPFAPKRMSLYKKWLSEFSNEAGLFDNIVIPNVPDTGAIAIPNECELKTIAFQKQDSEIFPGVKRYIISKDIWNFMSKEQRAGLVLHELIYREGIQVGHTTSFPTRILNAYLSSADPNGYEYAAVVSQMPLMWVEYGGSVVIQLGEMVSCKNNDCKPTFNRISEISRNEKNIKIKISEVLKDLITSDFIVKFSRTGIIPGPFVDLAYQDSRFTISQIGAFRNEYPIIKQVSLFDNFNLIFEQTSISLSYFKDQAFENRNFININPNGSWLNNQGQKIENITQIRDVYDSINESEGHIRTSIGSWCWSRAKARYIKKQSVHLACREVK